MFFALVVDVLSTMFNNAWNYDILHGVKLGDPGVKVCHLHNVDDFLIMMTKGGEDLCTIKLILYLFEGLIGLMVNSNKTCLYTSQRNIEPSIYLAKIMHYSTCSLPLTYLGIPLSGGLPRKQDWDILINMISSKLVVWKSKLLSLRGRLTLFNSVLTSIPTY